MLVLIGSYSLIVFNQCYKMQYALRACLVKGGSEEVKK